MNRNIERLRLQSVILLGLTIAVCVAFTGRCIGRRPRYLFGPAMGGVERIFLPLGAALGSYAIIVLVRKSVQELLAKEIVQNGTTG